MLGALDDIVLEFARNVADAEGGYLNAEPPVDGIAQEVPEGATVVQEDGKMYFQFDTVFFEQVTSNSGTSYRVVSFFTPSELRGLEKISDRRGVSLSAVIHSLVTGSLKESDGPA